MYKFNCWRSIMQLRAVVPKCQAIVTEQAMHGHALASRSAFGCMNSDMQIFYNTC